MTESIDPEWAWSPYQPKSDEEWTRRHAAHFHRRTGWGGTTAEIASALAETPTALAERVVAEQTEAESVLSESRILLRSANASGEAKNLPPWWLQRMLRTQIPLREKMTLFWHGHFATGAEKVTDPELMSSQNDLLRTHAVGNFGTLVHEISRDPAMLIYLDSVANRKGHPNENYAREIMELFVLGEGNYSENDIRELARCFTGWEIRRKKFRINDYQHDDGSKTIFGQSGPFDGDQGIDLVLEHPAGPEFIVGKFVRFFVADDLRLSSELLAPLANLLRESNWEISPVLTRLFASNLFYSSHAIGHKVRSPIEFALGFLRSCKGTANLVQLNQRLEPLGQKVFYPPNVKGWDGGRTWINSSTLLARANLIHFLLHDSATRFDQGSLAEYLESDGIQSADDLLERAQSDWLAVPLASSKVDQLTQAWKQAKGSKEQKVRFGLELMTALPEYQLG